MVAVLEKVKRKERKFSLLEKEARGVSLFLLFIASDLSLVRLGLIHDSHSNYISESRCKYRHNILIHNEI